VTAPIAQGLSPTQLAVLQRASETVQPQQPQPGKPQQRAAQPPAAPPAGTGRGRLVDILI
jgi:hypothetical protein